MTISVGSKVPNIKTQAWVRDAHEARLLVLSEYQGRWVILFFYPRDFTFICPTEIAAFASLRPDFEKERAVIVGASTDSFYSHQAWFETDARLKGVNYPVIADTSHEVSRAFDVLLPDGRALRATFIIDPEGTILHSTVSHLDAGRSIQETLRALQALRTGELCPADWKPGEPTLTTREDLLAEAFPQIRELALTNVSKDVDRVKFSEGELIVKEGQAADRLYVIAHGEVEVLKETLDGERKTIATLSAGQFFGEIGVLQEVPRTATVVAKTDVDLLALSKETAREIMEASEEAANGLTEVIGERLARV